MVCRQWLLNRRENSTSAYQTLVGPYTTMITIHKTKILSLSATGRSSIRVFLWYSEDDMDIQRKREPRKAFEHLSNAVVKTVEIYMRNPLHA